ncbi:membrane protein [hydrothermal vent metagenome]|uniref:Membrane protein n=1 Tax=hydrothermal vent metagenome TaxID=652676 RepID=A0A1W1BJZ3_9ZZZZ
MQSDEKKVENKEEINQDISIKTISQKTNISVNVVQNLFDKKFEKFSYPQAIGSIRIIERDFDMDMDSLRKECEEYFNEHPLDDGVSVLKPIDEDRPIIPQILIILILAFLAYGAWYFFTEYYSKQIISPSTIKTIKLSHTVLQKGDTEKKKIIEPKIIKEVQEANQSTESNKSNKIKEIKLVENNITTPKVIIDKNITEEKNSTKVEAILPVSRIVVEEVTKPVKEESKIITHNRKIITLIPNEYMWFRLIDLSNKKRRAYKRSTQYKIDMRENNWLFATENSSFSFKDNGKLYKYSDEGKLFYKLDQSGIHQLTEEQFRALEK